MKKYKIYRAGKDVYKYIKKHVLIGVELGEDIEDVFEDIQDCITADMVEDANCPYDSFVNKYIEIMPPVEGKYDYVALGIAVPTGSAPENIVVDYGIIEEDAIEI